MPLGLDSLSLRTWRRPHHLKVVNGQYHVSCISLLTLMASQLARVACVLNQSSAVRSRG